MARAASSIAACVLCTMDISYLSKSDRRGCIDSRNIWRPFSKLSLWPRHVPGFKNWIYASASCVQKPLKKQSPQFFVWWFMLVNNIHCRAFFLCVAFKFSYRARRIRAGKHRAVNIVWFALIPDWGFLGQRPLSLFFSLSLEFYCT